jgi:hypothetical protein
MTNRDRKIIEIFELFDKAGIRYAMLRGVARLLPSQLDKKKDIDILVHKNDKLKLHKILRRGLFIIDPRLSEYTYLYGVTEFRYYRNFFHNIAIDVCFELTCQSLNEGEVVPLDKVIQNNAFDNLVVDREFNWKKELSVENQMIYEISYALLNKGGEEGVIQNAYKTNDKEILRKVENKLEMVFFKYTSTLMQLLKNSHYEEIYSSYLTFKEY